MYYVQLVHVRTSTLVRWLLCHSVWLHCVKDNLLSRQQQLAYEARDEEEEKGEERRKKKEEE